MSTSFQPFSRLHSSDPETDRIVQDLYDKISQTAALAQQNSTGVAATPTPTSTPALTGPPSLKQTNILAEIQGVQASINSLQKAIRVAAAPSSVAGLQTQLNAAINLLNSLNAQLTA
jgi:hypothetical protein